MIAPGDTNEPKLLDQVVSTIEQVLEVCTVSGLQGGESNDGIYFCIKMVGASLSFMGVSFFVTNGETLLNNRIFDACVHFRMLYRFDSL